MRILACLILGLILTVSFKARAEEIIIKKDELLNLDRCIEIATKRHPDIIAALYTVAVNKGRVGQAKANYYPQLNSTYFYDRISPTTPGSAYNQYSSDITLSQIIFDFGKTSTQVSIQKLNLNSAGSDLENMIELIILNVKESYFGLLKATRNRDVGIETVKQYQQHLEQAKGFYEVGTKPKYDVIKAEVDLSNARLNLIRLENDLKIAQVNLNNALGLPEAPEYTIEDNLSFKKYETTLEDSVEKAYKGRPDLQSIIAKKKAAENSIALSKKGYYPIFTGNAAYNWLGEEYPMEHGWNVGVGVSFPIFNGFLTKYQVDESTANFFVLQNNEESLKQSILLEVQQSFLNLRAAEEAVPTAELAVKQAEENFDIANGRYATGVGNPIEVTDAEVTLTNAKTTYNQTLYDYKVAIASLERAIGIRNEVK
ncbi:MAG TPA: TolC family protein [Thermodesulfobacteriota bacterium]|nr:TolC family protein [Thermodesulfobacteriota bacterium]